MVIQGQKYIDVDTGSRSGEGETYQISLEYQGISRISKENTEMS